MKLLQKLVQIKSISGQERALACFIMDYCRANAVPAQMQSGNVVIYIKGENQSKALIFNAHMDTVSSGDLSKWRFPPYGKGAGKIIGGKLYGLGASDDKGAIAAMLGVAKNMGNPPLDLWLVFVTNEETDGSGTAKFLTNSTYSKYFKRYKKIAAVIGEPTDLKSIEIGHRGNAFIKLETTGVSGHAAREYQENDLAVEKMMKAVSILKETFVSWRKKYKDPILGVPAMNISSFNTANQTVNRIHSSCSVTLDIRTTPRLHEKITDLINKVVGNGIKITHIVEVKPPGYTSTEGAIVRTCKKVLPALSLTISMGSTDLSQFSQIGIEAVNLGPGNKDVIHKENEYIEVSKVLKCVKLYKKIIQNF
ncbi:M20/M25/M40 family metallo-hydrolase [Candidatus Gottesmanbacteria bacterium]|nr:M20/M25/M40 family metallo-hydrolase [Candidatus Gottesmanbacteria bacterium]